MVSWYIQIKCEIDCSLAASSYMFFFSVWNTVSGKRHGQSIQPYMLTQKPSTIQDDRTILKPLIPQTHAIRKRVFI